MSKARAPGHRGQTRWYRWGTLTLASRERLPELLRGTRSASAWTIRTVRARPSRHTWFHHWEFPDGARWLSFGHSGGQYVLRFARSGTFRVSLDSREIVCEALPGVPRETRRHLLLNQVLPLVAGVSDVVVHASAVRVAGGVIGFIGEGGAGKSTLAAALCGRGAALVCDDALMLRRERGRWLAVPGYPSLRLWQESIAAVFDSAVRDTRVAHYTGKRRVPATGVVKIARRRAPLLALCVLARRRRHLPAVRLTRLPAGRALVELLQTTFQMDLRDRARLVSLTEALADVVESVPVYRLRCASGLERLDEVADGILEAFRRGPAVVGA